MASIREIVLHKITHQQRLTLKQLEAWRQSSQIADVLLKKYPFLKPKGYVDAQRN